MKRKVLLLVLSVFLIISIFSLASAAETIAIGTDDGSTGELKAGDIVTFGSYPQSRVTDEEIIAALDADEGPWASLGYYAEGSVSDFMKYKDVDLGGWKYRGIIIEQYRPFSGTESCPEDEIDSFQCQNGYTAGTVWWFRFEPIRWRVLDPDEGYLLSEDLLDAQAVNNVYYDAGYYDEEEHYFIDESCSAFANNYEYSSIRSWLNGSFYETAFSESQREMIKISEVDNGSPYEQYASAATYDKIFLPSYDDLNNEEYGFAYTEDYPVLQTMSKGTDYAKCQNLWVDYESEDCFGYSYYWTRTASCFSDTLFCVSCDGFTDCDDQAMQAHYGVRPAVKLEQVSRGCDHNWLLEASADPTCTEDGFEEYICSVCGEKDIRTLPALGHSWVVMTMKPTCTRDGYQERSCTRCGYKETTSVYKAYGHHYIDTVTQPTCTEFGYTEHRCTNCGIKEYDEFTDPLGHTGEWKVTVPATCYESGQETMICDRCGVSLTREIPTNGHTWGAWESIIPVGVLNPGILTHRCEVCGLEETSIIPQRCSLQIISEHDVKITGLDANSAYTIYYAPGAYSTAEEIRTSEDGGFLYVKKVTQAGLYLPDYGLYTVAVVDADGNEYVETVMIEQTEFETVVDSDGLILTLSGYGANNISYIRFAKGEYETVNELKAAEDLCTYGSNYFEEETASFEILDAEEGKDTVYTMQIVYKNCSSELVTFIINPERKTPVY